MNGALSCLFYESVNGYVMIAPDGAFDADYGLSTVTSYVLFPVSGVLPPLGTGR